MEKRLGRRVALFVRTIALVWLLSAVAWLQKLDSHDLRGDVHDLRLLAEVGRIEPAAKLQALPDGAFDNTVAWLSDRYPEVAEGRAEVRRNVVDLLLERGVPESLVGRFSGKSSGPSHKAVRFHFLQVLDLPNSVGNERVDEIAIPSLHADSPAAHSKVDPWTSHQSAGLLMSVSHVLDELEQLARPREMVCAIEVDAEDLQAADFGPAIRKRPYILHRKQVGTRAPSEVNSPDQTQTPTKPQPGVIQFGGPAPGLDANGNPIRGATLGKPHGEHPPKDDTAGAASAESNQVQVAMNESEIPGADLLREESSSWDDASWGGWRREGATRLNSQRDWLFVDSAELRGDSLCIDYMWADDPAGNRHDHDQDSDVDTDFGTHHETIVHIPVETAKFTGPSLLEVSDPSRSANEPLLQLAGLNERVSYLRRAYGHLPLEQATSLASEGLAQAYRSLSLFGFQFSTRRFPLAVVVCLAVALWLTLAALISARRRKLDVLRHIEDQSAVEMLVSNRYLRTLLWVVLPLSAVWSSLPLVPLPPHELLWLAFGSAVLIGLGAGCVWAAEEVSLPTVPRPG